MRTYLLLPRFWGFLSPLGSQSTRLRGYFTRLGEYTRLLYPSPRGVMVTRSGGVKVWPRASIFQGLQWTSVYALS